MATASEITMLRNALQGNETSMPDAHIEALFDEAELLYPNNSRRVQYLYARYAGAVRLMTAAAKHVTYQQNERRESLSDMTKNLKATVDQYKKEFDDALSDDGGSGKSLPPVRWGHLRDDGRV